MVLRRTFRSRWNEVIGRAILFIICNLNDQIDEDEVCMTCSMHGREEECLQGFGGKDKRKKAIWKPYILVKMDRMVWTGLMW
jgi:hypothetical protein